MTQDISPEGYETYLIKQAIFAEQWPRIAGQPKTYEEWAETMQHRDHPRWVEYMDARRSWKAATFHLVYSPSVVSSPLPPFPGFEEWLEQKHDDEYFPEEQP